MEQEQLNKEHNKELSIIEELDNLIKDLDEYRKNVILESIYLILGE